MAYVYLHTKPNGEIFYVGKGSGYRAYDKTNRNSHWKRTVNKYGYNVSIFLDNLSDKKAYSVEMDLIEAIGLENLTNMNKGGEGIMTGLTFTDEHKRKISKALKGKKVSKETRLNMSKAQKGRVAYNKGLKMSDKQKKKLSDVCKGRVVTKETRDKISKALKGKKRTEEAKRNMSRAQKGIKCSEEAKLKIAEAQKVKVIDTITNIKYDSISEYCERNKISKTTFHYHFNGLTKKNKFKHIKRL